MANDTLEVDWYAIPSATGYTVYVDTAPFSDWRIEDFLTPRDLPMYMWSLRRSLRLWPRGVGVCVRVLWRSVHPSGKAGIVGGHDR